MHPITLHAESVSAALSNGLGILMQDAAVKEESRNGSVRVWPGPVTTVNRYPLRRVMFSPLRNANPFFHLFESLWMLAGRNDLPIVAQFNQQMMSYSDDGGKTQPAAYGYRWRHHFGYDQLVMLINELRRNPTSRRCVLAMWDGGGTYDPAEDGCVIMSDLDKAIGGSADVPCNTQCYFTIREGELHMGVMCRSNDILWGAHGANAVHFSILQEYVAAYVGVGVGTMTQFSWNYHLYDGILKHPIEAVLVDLAMTDRYLTMYPIGPTPIFHPDTMGTFEHDLKLFMDMLDPAKPSMSGFDMELTHDFLKSTALPMWEAWRAWKQLDVQAAIDTCSEIEGSDWQIACTEWFQRRMK